MIKDEEEQQKWLASLKPGDKLAIIDQHFGSIFDIEYDTVKKILPSGVIVTTKKYRFRSDGSEQKTRDRMSLGYCKYIKPISDETNIWKRTHRANFIISTTDFKTLPLEKLEAIVKIIKSPIPEMNQGDQGTCVGSTGREP